MASRQALRSAAGDRVYMQSGGGDVARYEHAGLAEVACQWWLAGWQWWWWQTTGNKGPAEATRRARALAPPSPCTRRSTP